MITKLKLLALATALSAWLPAWSTNSAADKTELQQPLSALGSSLHGRELHQLIAHHRIALANRQADLIAQELVHLTRGKNGQANTAAYLAAHTVKDNGNKDYHRARSLGQWLGSLSIALNEADLKSAAASSWFDAIVKAVDQEATGFDSEKYDGITRDIASGRLSITEAMELLSFGAVTSSSVTTVIGQGIRSVERLSAE